MYIEGGDLEDVIELLVEFIEDIYDYLGVELPEDFDPDVELCNLVQAIKDKRNAV